MTRNIFISYSKKDKEFAYKLADDLKAAGFKIWIDQSIGGGDEWRATIEENLKSAGEVIVIISPDALKSEWVPYETTLARGAGKPIYLILYKPVSSLPPWLDIYQYIDFVNIEPNMAFESLVKALTPPNPIQDLLDQEVSTYHQTGDLMSECSGPQKLDSSVSRKYTARKRSTNGKTAKIYSRIQSASCA